MSVFLLFLSAAVVGGAKVTLFEKAGFKGPSLNLTMEYENRECINFPDNWVNRVSSANTGNLCVELYSELNCGGKKIALYPSTHHYDMTIWIFDKAARSIRVCDQVIDDDHLENRFSILVRVYNSSAIVRGRGPGILSAVGTSEYHVNIFSCEVLPAFFRNKMQSIVTYQSCFRYFPNADCTGKEIKFPRNHIISDASSLNSVVSIGRCGYFIPPTTTTTGKPTTLTSPDGPTAKKTSLNESKTEPRMGTSGTEPSSCQGTSHFIIFSVISGTLLIAILVFATFYKFKKSSSSTFSWRAIKLTEDYDG